MNINKVTFWLPLLLFLASAAVAQSDLSLPSLYPAVQEAVGVEQGLPEPCLQYATIGEDGKLWLQPCLSSQYSYAVYLLQFNGQSALQYNFRDNQKTKKPVSSHFSIKGTTQEGLFYGPYWVDNTFYLMLFDPANDSLTIVGLEGTRATGGEWMQDVFKGLDGTISLTTIEGKEAKIYAYINNNLQELAAFSLPRSTPPNVSPIDLKCIGETAHEWWMTIEGGYPIRIDKKTNSSDYLLSTDFPQLKGGISNFKYIYFAGAEKSGSIFLTGDYQTYRYNSLNNKIHQTDYFPEGLHSITGNLVTLSICADSVGNRLYSFLGEHKIYNLLRDSTGRWFDYTAISTEFISSAFGANFKEKIQFTSRSGFTTILLQRKTNNPQTFPNIEGCRGITELNDHTFLLQSVVSSFVINTKTNEASELFDCTLRGGFRNFLKGPSGDYWFTKFDGLYRYHPGSGECKKEFDNRGMLRIEWLNENEILAIHQIAPISVYNTQTKELRIISTNWEKEPEHPINHTYNDNKGAIWIATGLGLYKFDIRTEKLKYFSEPEGLPDYRILHIYERSDGLLWIGTFTNGIVEFDPISEKVTRIIDGKAGLSNNTVVSILQDEEDYFWVATYYGLNLLNPEGNVLTSFTKKDGITHNEFNRLSCLKASDGRLLFGTVNGLNVIDPRKAKAELLDAKPLKIYISQILMYGDNNNKGTVKYTPGKSIVLNPADRHLEIEFGLSNYIQTSKNKFYYRLLGGGNKEWLKTENQSISLSNLSVGKYKIEIKGQDYLGRITQEPILIPLIVKRAFYRYSWFYALSGLVLLLFGGSYVLLLRRKNLQLNQEVERRIAQNVEDKQMIEQQTTALFNVGDGTDAEENKKLSGLVQDLLSLSQIDKKKLPEEEYSIAKLSRTLFEEYRPQAHLKVISYSLHCAIDENMLISINKESFNRVVGNLLSNALKTSPINSHVYVSLSAEADWVFIHVRDSGSNIPEEDIPYLFDRYFHTKSNNSRAMGVEGIGLALASEIARLMGGKIEVESIDGKGNTLLFRFPLKSQ